MSLLCPPGDSYLCKYLRSSILEDKKAVFATRQYVRQTGPLERAQSFAYIKVPKRMEF